MNLSGKRSAVVAVAICLLTCGAASAQDLKSIKQITIDAEIPQPEIPLIQSPGGFKAFMIAGGIGAAVDQQEAGKLFREYMRKNNIDVSKIVLESFRRAIQEDKIFVLADTSDAKLKLVINNYGFGASGFFGGPERKPLMNITASLVSGGNVIWKKTEFLTNLSSLTQAYTYDQLGQTPELTVKSLQQIADLVSRQILAEFKQ